MHWEHARSEPEAVRRTQCSLSEKPEKCRVTRQRKEALSRLHTAGDTLLAPFTETNKISIAMEWTMSKLV